MKRTLISIIILFAAGPCAAQWKDADFYGNGSQVLAFGVHDTSLFVSIPGYVARWNPKNPPPMDWVQADAGIGFGNGNVSSFSSLGTYFFAGMGTQNAYRSTNNGTNWKENIGAPVATNGMYLWGTFGTNIARSTDSGNDWQHLSTTLVVQNYATLGWYIFASTGSALWRSTDTGNHWSLLSSPFVGTMVTMGSLIFITGTTNGSVIESADSGTQWTPVTVDSSTVPEHVTCLATDGKNLFAGTTSGVLISRDTGKSWQMRNEGLAVTDVIAMGVFDTLLFIDIYVFNSSWKYFAYDRSIPEMLADTGPASVVQPLQPSDSLEIYPNPATGMVTVISSNQIQRVTVRNVLGEQIWTTPQPPPISIGGGVTLDLTSVPSGIYFLQIQTPTGPILRKITIER